MMSTRNSNEVSLITSITIGCLNAGKTIAIIATEAYKHQRFLSVPMQLDETVTKNHITEAIYGEIIKTTNYKTLFYFALYLKKQTHNICFLT